MFQKRESQYPKSGRQGCHEKVQGIQLEQTSFPRLRADESVPILRVTFSRTLIYDNTLCQKEQIIKHMEYFGLRIGENNHSQKVPEADG
jgi:hypothetical protein